MEGNSNTPKTCILTKYLLKSSIIGQEIRENPVIAFRFR